MIHDIVRDSLITELRDTTEVRVPKSFIYTEWHFIYLSRSSSECLFVTSLLADSCTKRKTS